MWWGVDSRRLHIRCRGCWFRTRAAEPVEYCLAACERFSAIAVPHEVGQRRGNLRERVCFVLHEILNLTAQLGLASPLAVLKLFGEGQGMLSFPTRGYTLTMDFPVNNRTLALAADLDKIVLGAGGKLYLAKDARMSADVLSRTYAKDLDDFRAVKQRLDPTHRIRSIQSDRLGVYG